VTRLLLLLLLAPPLLAQDVLVVTPEEFEPALEAWRAHREAQGHVIAVARPPQKPSELVRRAYAESGKKLKYVLLLGDVKQIPVAYEAGETIKVWERDPRIAHDNAYADLDGDDLPDLAVGRLPADNVNEARELLGKVIAYETSADKGPWLRRVNVLAGVGGFGALADWAIEQVATKFLQENVPAEYDLHVTYANPSSPFCPPPSRIGEIAVERFNEGALVVAYLGHGSRMRLDRLRFRSRAYTIFDDESVYELEARHGAPIVFFCACSTGHVDGAPDSLAEMAVKRRAGPVAIIASSRVSMPYANGVLAKELLEAMLQTKTPTVGEALALAKRRTMRPAEDDPGRAWIETLARTYKWKDEERAAERREHVFLYNLFGDPSMRLPHPAAAELACAEEIAPGARLKVEGKTPVNGQALIEFATERTPLVPRRRGDDDAAFARAYERANDRVRASAEAAVEDGRFSATLVLPDDLASGTYHVRVFVRGEDRAAMGARTVNVVVTESKEPE